MKDSSIIIGMATVAVIIGVVIFLNGGGSISRSQLAQSGANSTPSVAVPFTEITRGAQSAVTGRVNYLITSDSELTKLWSMIKASGKPPIVDFKTQVVVAIFSGADAKTSPAIAVVKIEDASTRTVSVKLDYCAKNNSTNYQIVVMPTTTLHLAHQDQIIQTNCKS